MTSIAMTKMGTNAGQRPTHVSLNMQYSALSPISSYSTRLKAPQRPIATITPPSFPIRQQNTSHNKPCLSPHAPSPGSPPPTPLSRVAPPNPSQIKTRSHSRRRLARHRIRLPRPPLFRLQPPGRRCGRPRLRQALRSRIGFQEDV